MTNITTRVVVPLATTAAFLAWIVSYVAFFLQSTENGVVKGFILVIAMWLSTGLLRYCHHISTLQFPGPVPFPIIGNCLFIAKAPNLQECFAEVARSYGAVVDLLLIQGNRVVVVNDGSFCKTAIKSMDRGDLSGPNWKNNWREHFLWVGMNGAENLDLFSRSNEIMDWTAHRRLLQPAFDQKHVRAMTAKIETTVQDLVTRLPVEEKFDIKPFFESYGLAMIHLTAFGRSVSDLADGGRFLVDILSNMTKLFGKYQFDPFLYLTVKVLPFIGLNSSELQRRKDVPVYRKYVRGMLQDELKKKGNSQNDDGSNVNNLLSIMIKGLNDKFGTENLADELSSFIFAGYDTCAVTLSNLVYHLACNPDVQQKIQQEIDVISSRQPAYAEMVREMPYLSACIRESQRLQPVAPLLQRRLQEDLTVGSVVLAKRTVVLIPCFLLHRDPELYPDPESFKPQRWLDTGGNLRPPRPGYFYAFGAGPKMCIGFQLAELVVKMAAAAILKECSIESRGAVKIVDAFTTGPETVHVKLTKRSK